MLGLCTPAAMLGQAGGRQLIAEASIGVAGEVSRVHEASPIQIWDALYEASGHNAAQPRIVLHPHGTSYIST